MTVSVEQWSLIQPAMPVNAFTAPAHGHAVAACHGNNHSLEEAPLLDLWTGDTVI